MTSLNSAASGLTAAQRKSHRSATRKLAPVKPAPYLIGLARNAQEFRAALRLRYEVFNLELQEGLSSSHATGYDFDAFDAVADHIIVTCASSNQVVGTYRVQTGATARHNLGYYSEQEFKFAAYENIRKQVLELGRACIHRDHRSTQVLMLLWKAVTAYALGRGCRYLIGCSSVSSQDPIVAAHVYSQLQRFLAPPELLTVPQPDYAIPDPADTEEEPSKRNANVPKLLRAYLAVGAYICGPPALDRNFGTIDFLTLLDLARLPKGLFSRVSEAGQ